MESLLKFFNKRYRLIFITGQSAAMKSQTAHKLAEVLTTHSAPHMLHSIGDICRNKLKEDSRWRNAYKDLLENAALLPAEAIVPLWLPHVKKFSLHHHIVEGAPRSLEEVKLIEPYLQILQRKALLIHLHVHDDDALAYLRKRNVIEQRTDLESDDKIRKKLAYYHSNVVPGINLAMSSPHFHVVYRHISVGETLEAVFQDISKKIANS